MSERRIDVFFYGLFMDTEILRAGGVAEPANPRRAFVDDFELRIGQRATLVPVADSRVYGMLFALTHSETCYTLLQVWRRTEPRPWLLSRSMA
jgi:hypothetical protein